MISRKIVFEPVDGSANEYVGIILEQLRMNNIHVFSLKEMFSSLKVFKSIRVIHLNWYENVFNEIDFVKKVLNLLVFRLTRKRIVWTMHNKMPHNKDKSIFQKILMFMLAKNAKVIITHSKISEEVLIDRFSFLRKRRHIIKYVPHPNYIDVYGKPVNSPSLEKDKLRLLFMGAVKPYKGIELLIKIANEFPESELLITIAGQVYSEVYKDRLLELVSNVCNVDLILKFIPNEDIPKYLAEVDLLILPYDTLSSLNSGTVILGFSYGKSAICPEIGTTLDVLQKDKILLYKYNDPDDHFFVLKEKVREAMELKKADSTVFDKWGEKMKTEVDYYNDKNKIGTKLSNIYSELLID